MLGVVCFFFSLLVFLFGSSGGDIVAITS
jgi:hypothetical protein